jgi:hypothetical protein
MKNFSNIEDRLQASIKYDVINGNYSERLILRNQIIEAINTIKELRQLQRVKSTISGTGNIILRNYIL